MNYQYSEPNDKTFFAIAERETKDMTLNERISYHTGSLLMAIGEGKTLRDGVFDIISQVSQDAYARGLKDGAKEPACIKKP